MRLTTCYTLHLLQAKYNCSIGLVSNFYFYDLTARSLHPAQFSCYVKFLNGAFATTLSSLDINLAIYLLIYQNYINVTYNIYNEQALPHQLQEGLPRLLDVQSSCLCTPIKSSFLCLFMLTLFHLSLLFTLSLQRLFLQFLVPLK